MKLEFEGTVFEWRGPAPFYFVAVPDDDAVVIHDTAAAVTYGWGMIPVGLRIGNTTWETSLWPKDGSYVVPLKDAVRRAEGIDEGDVVSITLVIDV